jgi:hypothetical protein
MKTKDFKTTTFIILIVSCFMLQLPAYGKNDGVDRKDARQITQFIRKETKKLTKDGFRAEVGAPGMEWQLRQSFEKQLMTDEEGNNLFVVGVGSAVSGIQNVARRHAASDAQIDACTQLESKIMGLIENDYNNRLYSRNEFETLSRMKGVFSNLLAQTLPIGSPICTIYKDNGKYYDFQIRIAYSSRMMAERSKTVISEILSKENDELRKKFERITGLDRLGSTEQEK